MKVGETLKLSMLERSIQSNKVLILQTSSNNMNIFVMDSIKKQLRCNQDTMRTVVSKKDIKAIKEIYNVEPYLSDRWLVTIQLDKFSGGYKEIIEMITDSTTVMFVCVADRYPVFKGFRDALNRAKMQQFCELYLTYMRSDDFHYLYRTLVPEDKRMPKTIADFVCQSYGADIDAEFELFRELQSGTVVKTRKTVSEICGIGGNSIESFVMSLLKDPPRTAKGATIVIKNRLQAGEDLAQVYGYRKFYNFLSSCVKQLMDLKMLILAGVVYNRIPELPSCYDDKKIMRYQRFLWRVRKIPLSRLVRLKTFIGDEQWISRMDLQRFVYTFYKDLIQYEVIPYLPKTSVFDEYVEAKKKEDEIAKKAEEEQEEVNQRRAVELIRKYGVIEGRRRFAEEKERGITSAKSGESFSTLVKRKKVSEKSTNALAAAAFRGMFGTSGG